MPFAFGQKINLVQGGRSGVNPIKWGFLGDISGGQNGQSIPSLLNAGIYNSGAMAIPSPGPSGNVATCIGVFGPSGNPGFTSGNNINDNLEPYGSGNLQSPEMWRNVEIPPNVRGITMYVETRPSPPGNVVEDAQMQDCKGGALCSGSACDQCGFIFDPNCEGAGCEPVTCTTCGTAFPFCCGGRGSSGAEAGCFSIFIDLSSYDQQTLYLYTSWFNGLMPGGYDYDGVPQEPTTDVPGFYPSAGSVDRCDDNMRFVLFPRAADDADGTPPPWPYSDMTTPLVDIRVYRAGHTIPPRDGTGMPYYVCVNSLGDTACPEPTNSDGCLPCEISTCDGCRFTNINDDASEAFVASTVLSNTPIIVTSTVITHEQLWGEGVLDPNGTTTPSNTGIWNTVFGWNTSLEDTFTSLNYGGPELLGKNILCADASGSFSGDRDIRQISGCTGTWKDQLPVGSTYANGITGAQVVGFHVG
jgi:hypothetical protein